MHVRTVEPVAAHVPTFEPHELAAPKRPGVPHQQQRGVAAFEYFAGPPGYTGASESDDRGNIGRQQRGTGIAWPIPRRGIVATNTG